MDKEKPANIINVVKTFCVETPTMIHSHLTTAIHLEKGGGLSMEIWREDTQNEQLASANQCTRRETDMTKSDTKHSAQHKLYIIIMLIDRCKQFSFLELYSSIYRIRLVFTWLIHLPEESIHDQGISSNTHCSNNQDKEGNSVVNVILDSHLPIESMFHIHFSVTTSKCE